MTASLEGKIVIHTSDIDEAIKAIEGLGQKLGEIDKNAKSIDVVAQAFKEITKQSKAQSKAVQDSTKASNDSATAQERIANLVARASSRMSDFEQTVRKSNASQFEQLAAIERSKNALKAYQQNLETAGHSGLALDTANTQLTTSMAQLKRELKEAGTSGAAQQRAIDNLSISYEKMVQEVTNSSMAEEKKVAILSKLKTEQEAITKVLQSNNTSTREAAQAQGTFKKAMGEATQEVKKSGQEMKKAQVANFNKQMSDMSSSVQLALGPLSGVASRVTALGALFKRNAASVAALTASFTGFSVALMKTISIGREAERQVLAMDAQVNMLGMSAATSGSRLNDMARDIAGATLTSAQAVREAQSALLEFRNIGVESFEDVLLTAQGLSQTFGGSLADATKRLGRLLNDPISNFDALSRQGITFNKVERERLTTLVQTGRLQEAQNEITQRFIALQERAKNETGGLSGQMDALGDNLAMAAEKLFAMGGTSSGATQAVKALSDAIAEFADSEAAVSLANAFGRAVRGVATALEYAIKYSKQIGVLMMGAVVAGITRVVVGLTLWTLRSEGLIATLGRKIKALFGVTAATKAAATATTGATVAVTGFRRALMFAVPVLGIAAMALEVLGVINMFTPSQEAQLKKMQEEVKESTDRAVALREAIEGNDRITVDVTPLQKAEEAVADLEKQLGEAVKARESLGSKPIALASGSVRGMDTSASVRAADEYNQKLRESEEAINNTRAALNEARVVLDEQIESTENQAAEQDKATRRQEEYTNSLQTAYAASRAITDSEGSRIDSIKDQISRISDLINREEDLVEANADLIKQLKEERELLTKRKQEMQANSRENREAERSRLRLVRIQSDLNEQEKRAAAFQNNSTEASLEAALAAIAQEKQLARNVERVSTLNEEHLRALASSLGLSEAFAETTATAGGAEAGVRLLAQGLTEQTQAAIEAEQASKRLTAAQQVAQSLQEKFDPMAGLQHEVAQDRDTILQSDTMDYQEQAKALADLEKYFQMEKETIERGRAWMFEDAFRFTPLTESEQLERDLQERQAVIDQMTAEEREKYKDHIEKMNAEADKQRAMTKFGEDAQKGADIFEGAMDAMQSASQENTRAYKIIAMAQATMAGAAAITKAYNEGGLLLGGVMAAKVGAQVGAIAATGFNDGGYVSGKGSGRSDSIAANLSNGEFVLRKRAVDSLGVGFLKRLNDDGASAFNMGGMVGGAAVISNNVQRSGGVSLQIINNGSPLEVDRTEMTEGEDGEMLLKAFVRQATQNMHEEGTLDGTMSTSYGLSRKPRRR